MSDGSPSSLPDILVAQLTRDRVVDYLSDLAAHAGSLAIRTRGRSAANLAELESGILDASIVSAQLRYVREDRATVDTILRRGDGFELVRA